LAQMLQYRLSEGCGFSDIGIHPGIVIGFHRLKITALNEGSKFKLEIAGRH
jgi:hypothetical protein